MMRLFNAKRICKRLLLPVARLLRRILAQADAADVTLLDASHRADAAEAALLEVSHRLSFLKRKVDDLERSTRELGDQLETVPALKQEVALLTIELGECRNLAEIGLHGVEEMQRWRMTEANGVAAANGGQRPDA